MTLSLLKHILLVLMITPLLLYCGDDTPGNDRVEPKQQKGRQIEPEEQVIIYDSDQEIARVDVALARTESERNTGLMNVYEMPFDTGMLFIFDDEQPRSFWMVNTPISLDILFLNRHREIVRIRTNTTPFSERQVTSELPAQYVLEVNAGFCREHDIREGMRMDW